MSSRWLVVCLLGVLVGAASRGGAQAREESADTGRMVPAHRDFSRYTTPGQCLMAVRTVRMLSWRRGEHDTAAVAITPEHDTLPTAAVTAARECGAKFTVNSVAPRDLRHMMQLSLAMGNITQARAARDRAVALAATRNERVGVLLDAFESFAAPLDYNEYDGEWDNRSWKFTGAQPRRHSDALNMAAQIDSLGRDTRKESIYIHAALLRYAHHFAYDTAAMKREAQALTRALALLTPAERDSSAYTASPHMTALELAFYRRPPIPIARALAEASDQLLREAQMTNPTATERSPIFAVIAQLAQLIGTPARPIAASYWFNAQGDTVQPRSGKVTLVWEVNTHDANVIENRSKLAWLRRMHEKYGASGLQIIIVASAKGYVFSSPPLSLADEAKILAWFYLDYWKLPVTLAVAQTPSQLLPDGTRALGQPPIRAHFPPGGNVLVSRDGTIRTNLVGATNTDVAETEAFIRQELGM